MTKRIRATPGRQRPAHRRGGLGRVVAALGLAVTVAACGSPAAPRGAAAGGAPGGAAGGPGESPTRLARAFDLQAHRGGAGLETENTVQAFSDALDLGVSTLEMDAQVTKDLVVVIAHDTKVNPDKCRDTRPSTAGDPEFPYVGKRFRDLTAAQVATLDCGFQRLEAFPDQRVVTGAAIPRLTQVFDLLRHRDAEDVQVNLEIKVQSDNLAETVPRQTFVAEVAKALDASGMAKRVTIQSFDWSSLVEMHRVAPDQRLVALTQPDKVAADGSGESPWLGLDIATFGGDIAKAAASIDGVVSLSPRQDFPVDAALVRSAHAAGLLVVPWTVDKTSDMDRLIGLGVDGLITNRPDRLRTEMQKAGLPLPEPARAPS